VNYFFDCSTKEEAKAKYRKLAKELHPDKGGKIESMKELQRQYDDFSEHDHKTNNIYETFSKAYTNYNYRPFGSEQSFKDNIRNAFRSQNADTPYHQHTNTNELQRLRDENHQLRGNIYQLEKTIERSKIWETHLQDNYLDAIRQSSSKDTQIQELNKELEEIKKYDLPTTRFHAFLDFIYFMIKGKPMEIEKDEE
jgi:curved DNA-binding protein CbpA